MLKEIMKYLLVVNIFVFILMGIDKFLAIKNSSRIPEKFLLVLGLFGGGLGGYLSMLLFRHKTLKWYFRFCFIIGIVIALVSIVYGGFYGS